MNTLYRYRTPEKRVWLRLRESCKPQPDKVTPTMHPSWFGSYEIFYRAVGPKPDRYHKLRRIDATKGYEPGNVIWAPIKSPMSQTSKAAIRLYGNTPIENVALYVEITGLSRSTIYRKIKEGSTLESLQFYKRGTRSVGAATSSEEQEARRLPRVTEPRRKSDISELEGEELPYGKPSPVRSEATATPENLPEPKPETKETYVESTDYANSLGDAPAPRPKKRSVEEAFAVEASYVNSPWAERDAAKNHPPNAFGSEMAAQIAAEKVRNKAKWATDDNNWF